ncbi:hypothetical protein [Streptomyces cinereoruber]
MPRFDDPALQAIYDYLATGYRSGRPDAAAIAAREGLKLGLGGRRAARRSKADPTRRPRPATRQTVLVFLKDYAPTMRTEFLQVQAARWAGLMLPQKEIEHWIRALGVTAASQVADCRRYGIGLASLGTVLDGHPARRWLRGGECAAAVHARAAAAGIDLSS